MTTSNMHEWLADQWQSNGDGTWSVASDPETRYSADAVRRYVAALLCEVGEGPTVGNPYGNRLTISYSDEAAETWADDIRRKMDARWNGDVTIYCPDSETTTVMPFAPLGTEPASDGSEAHFMALGLVWERPGEEAPEAMWMATGYSGIAAAVAIDGVRLVSMPAGYAIGSPYVCGFHIY